MVPGTVIQVASVNTGVIEPIGPNSQGTPLESAIHKRPVSGDVVTVTLDGIAGDEHHNPRVHGGPLKAIYAYPYTHYPRWEQQLGVEGLLPGSFGENLTLSGQLTESDVAIGEIYQWGPLQLRVVTYRQPCEKLIALFRNRFDVGDADMRRLMKRNGRCGFYLEVLEPEGETGPWEVSVDEPLVLVRAVTEFRKTVAEAFREWSAKHP